MTTGVKQQPVADFTAYGTVRSMLSDTGKELVFAGPAGTGKTRGGLEKLDAFCRWFPGCRTLITRKTRASLTQSTLVIFEREVLGSRFSDKHDKKRVYYHGGDMEYRYPNGSVAITGGLDKSAKIMSSQYDLILVDEATEASEGDYEDLTTRLRNGKASFDQLLSLCNPDSPVHHLKRREAAKKLRMIDALHTDNPRLFDQQQQRWTKAGEEYVLGRLENLTGTRKLRLRFGIWCMAEGMVFDGFNQDEHLFFGWNEDNTLRRDGDTGAKSDADYKTDPPKTWRRSLSVDFGFSNPFVCQFWSEDEDSRFYMYREIYRSKRIVEEHAADIIKMCDQFDEPAFEEVIMDHDAEDRATLEKHLRKNWRFATTAFTPAEKPVESGCDMVRTRLKKQADGRPRIYFRRDAVYDKDQELELDHKPTCTVDEIWSYVYDPKTGKPVKLNDHGCDAARYKVATRDLKPAHNYVQTPFRR